MKKILIFIMATLIFGIGGIIYGESTPNHEQLILGKWRGETERSDWVTEFTVEKQVIANGEIVGTYNFLEDQPIMMIKYENVTIKYQIQFEDDNTLIRTQVSLSGKKMEPEVLRRVI